MIESQAEFGNTATPTRGKWSNQWAFILATTGSAVGLGNIWRFPYVTGENGGGAFVLVYLACVLLLGIPLMFSEMMVGRRGKSNPVGSMAAAAREASASPLWKGVGLFAVSAGFLILTYYIAVAGWTFIYIPIAMSGTFVGATPDAIHEVFVGIQNDPVRLAFWSAVVMIATVFIVSRGIEKGLEQASFILMPGLFVILVLLVIYTMTSGFFSAGFAYMFRPDFSELTGQGVLIAMGQAFFSLSIGSGATLVYGSYMPQEIHIGKTACWVAGMDTLVAILAGLCIFPLVIAYDLEAGSGPGLIFETLPLAFGQMPFGTAFGTLFFVMLTFAVITSTIALLEPAISWLTEKFSISRFQACASSGLVVWIIGLGTVFSYNIWSDKTVYGKTMFEMTDYITAAWMLPLGGLFVAVFCGWIMARSISERELDLPEGLYGVWRLLIRYLAPACIIVIFLNALGIL